MLLQNSSVKRQSYSLQVLLTIRFEFTIVFFSIIALSILCIEISILTLAKKKKKKKKKIAIIHSLVGP
jgi:hypothetical protein